MKAVMIVVRVVRAMRLCGDAAATAGRSVLDRVYVVRSARLDIALVTASY